jgi:hypothetical protein
MSGDHNKSSINNLFGNFKKSCIVSFVHVWDWCRKKDVDFSTHPQTIVPKGKPILLTNENHKRVVTEGIIIIKFVNAPFVADDQPFVLVGDLKSSKLKSLVQSKMYLLQLFLSTMPSKEEYGGTLEESHGRDQTCKNNWRCFE